MKKCSKCKQEKERTEFTKDANCKDGLRPSCRECHAIYRDANKEKSKASTKKWRENNALEFAKMKRKWRLANLEKCKAQRIENYNANKDRELASGRKYKEEHKERLAKYQYDKYWADPVAARDAMLRYRRANPDKSRAWRMRRIAAEKQAIPLWADHDAILKAYEAADMMMQLLGERFEVDHVVPLQSKLVCGLHVANNLQILSMSDNRKKSNRHWPDMP